MKRPAHPKTERLFWTLGAALIADDPSVAEGTIMNGRCLRVHDEFLALVDFKGSGLVVKLSAARVAELVASGMGQPFAPAGRVFKEWVSIPKPDRRRWNALLREGIALAKRAASRRLTRTSRATARSRADTAIRGGPRSTRVHRVIQGVHRSQGSGAHCHGPRPF